MLGILVLQSGFDLGSSFPYIRYSVGYNLESNDRYICHADGCDLGNKIADLT